MRALLKLTVATAVVSALGRSPSYSSSGTTGPEPPPASAATAASFATLLAPFFKANCVRCHGSDRHESGLRLDALDGHVALDREGPPWGEIRDRLSAGEMPPKKEARPRQVEVDGVVAWIDAALAQARRARPNDRARERLRRLNRTEYANTIRDLLDVQFAFDDGPLDLLPAEGTVDGFDKIGSALVVDPSLLDRYLTLARRVADKAIVTGPRPFESRRRRFEYEDTARSPAIGYECSEPYIICEKKGLVLMHESARTWDHVGLDPRWEAGIPTDGVYKVRLRMSAKLGARREPLKVQILWPSVIAAWTLTERDAAPRVYEVTLPLKVAGKGREGPQVHLTNGTPFHVPNQLFYALHGDAEKAEAAGDHARADQLLARAKAEGAASSDSVSPAVLDRGNVPRVLLDWIEVEGPLLGEWPPLSHQRIFFEGPGAKKDPSYARRIFARLLPRAYRRPVSAAEVDAVVRQVDRELRAGEPFEEAIKVGLEYVLTSPRFLYLFAATKQEDRQTLDDFELAARLSYFLWSTMPDDTLLGLAAQGRLRSREVLEDQVNRMLRDRKSQAFIDGFATSWLQAQRFVAILPNRQIYPAWDDDLEGAVKREPLAFFEEVFRNDLSATNFLDSDFAMLNARLARHYGVRGVEGEKLRRVKLPADSHRGGLLTQAAILTIGSDGTRTLPVRRASWILQTLFNAAPPPPPPNAGQVEPNLNGSHLTVRDRLLQHQKIASCASCHRKIDGYGLGLENYDAVGAWRTRQNGEDFSADDPDAPAIDSSGALPDGRLFADVAQFRTLVGHDTGRFGRALTEKILSYALGRSLADDDRAVVDGLAGKFRQSGYRMSVLMRDIVTTRSFQTR